MQGFTVIWIGGNGPYTYLEVHIFARDVSLYSVFETVRWNPARRSYSNGTLNSTRE